MTQLNNLTDAFDLNTPSSAALSASLPGVDGSVLGAGMDVDASAPMSRRTEAFRLPRSSDLLWGAAVGGGLLALAAAFITSRLLMPPRRSFLGSLTRRRPRRWSLT
jgi:hypothetical protein